MPKIFPTNAENLEAKFDGGADVLDYFDLRAPRVSSPPKVNVITESLTIRTLTPPQLKEAIRIREQIERLQFKLNFLLNAPKHHSNMARSSRATLRRVQTGDGSHRNRGKHKAKVSRAGVLAA